MDLQEVLSLIAHTSGDMAFISKHKDDQVDNHPPGRLKTNKYLELKTSFIK